MAANNIIFTFVINVNIIVMYFKQVLMLILIDREDGKEQRGEGQEFRFGKCKGKFAHSFQN